MTHMHDSDGGTPDVMPESAGDGDPGRELAILAARTASDMKATDVMVLDVGAVLSIAGFFVIASASNPRQVSAVVEEVEARAKGELSRSPIRSEGLREQQWTLLDYGDVVVHVFLDTVREFYEIERLYRDAPRVEWELPPPAAASTSG
jgi:ribosome-associated protein